MLYDYVGIEKWATGQWRTGKQVSMDYVSYYAILSVDVDVSFTKVKAHSGVEYNELADKLAKEALFLKT